MKVIDTFVSDAGKVELFEDYSPVTEEYRTLRHEVCVTPRLQNSIVLGVEELSEIGKLLLSAMERAKERQEKWDADDEVPSTI